MTSLTDRYSQAVEMARKLHDGHVRKGTAIPYLSHVLAVSALVLEYGGDEDQAIAAVLHDAAEDAGGQIQLDEITAEFGPDVGSIVETCSDSLMQDPARKDPWWERKVHHIAHLAAADERVLLVAAADKTHNAQALLFDYEALGESVWSRFNADSGRGGQLWYHQEISNVLRTQLTDQPAKALAERHAEIVRTLISTVEANVGSDQVAEDLVAAAKRAESVTRD